MNCKTYWLATVSSLAIVGVVTSATAADLPARMPVKAPVAAPAPAFSWTGFYIGVQGGGAWIDHKQQSTINGTGFCGLAPSAFDCTVDKFGGAFGGLAGYNFQSGQAVFGVEVDGTWLSVKGTTVYANAPLILDPLTINAKVEWLATIRGRIGLAMSTTLFYVTGGVAFGGVKAGWSDGPGTTGIQIDKTKTGWVAGGGIEYAVAPNWLVRIEGLYHDLGKDTETVLAGPTYTTTFRTRVTTVRGAVALRW
jgi:outer membrane immunogenic protein